MLRWDIQWTGGPMGTGHTIINTSSAGSYDLTAAGAALTTWLDAVMNIMPSAITGKVQSTVELVDEDSGTITGTVTAPAQASNSGSGAGANYAAGVGARVRWQTNGFRNGRRVVGTSFIVPINGAAYDSDGSLTSATVTALTTPSAALVTALTAATSPLCVYSRPTAPGATDGELHLVTGSSVPDQSSWLTTRRS